jgi:hypothetical protein
MQTKGPNGTNLADEFAAAHINDLPKVQHAGRAPLAIDPAVMLTVRTILKTTDDIIKGTSLYGADAKELAEYNAEHVAAATLSGASYVPVADVETLAKRFAFNAAGNLRRYVAIIAKEKGLTVGTRVVNEGTADKPRCRWYLLLTNPRPRTVETATK